MNLIKDTLKLLAAFLKVNLQMSLAYRADTVVNLLLNLMWLGWELLSLNIIFSNTETIGGWNFGQLITLLGVFRLINMLMVALIWPNTEKFNQSIIKVICPFGFHVVYILHVQGLFVTLTSRVQSWTLAEAKYKLTE